jgi:predicted DNA-binding transcriptional regulator YafY
MRASRLVALLVWLQQRGGSATAPELATELEVSVRTVYRDVAALQAAGVPLWTETGPRGGVRLMEGWRTRLDGLTGEEAGSLFLAGAGPTVAAELGLGTVLASAQTKLLATLPPELRGRAGRVRQRFLLDAPQWFHHAEPLPCLSVVAEAVWADRSLAFDYQRAGRTVARRADPLGLVLKAGTWYTVARVGEDIRTYRVGRIFKATLTDERFERPADFDLAEWWAASAADFNAEILRASVRLRLSPLAQRLLPQVVDQAAALAALDGGEPADDGGWKTIDLAVESEEVALSQLLSLGDGVEVLDPPTLRVALANLGRAIASRNA